MARLVVSRTGFVVLIAACFITAACPNAQAAWPHDPNVNVPLCLATNTQVNPVIVSDGAGGAIVTWQDYRSGSNNDIYAQRVNAAGVPQWTNNGVALCTNASDQSNPTILSDGAGGAIITWFDGRGGFGNTDVYAQRVNAAGVPQWTADGVALCTAAGDQEYPTIASDGSGGAIVTWYDSRSGTNYDIYAQRVNAAGAPQWIANGVALCTDPASQYYPTIASDGAGGAIVTWYDYRSGGPDIYAQRVNGAGALQWTANGVAICTAANTQQTPLIASDGTGGAIVIWQDSRSGNYDVYAQRVNSAGVWLWSTNGVPVCTAAADQQRLALASDGAGGAIVAWDDLRGGNFDIYAQRVAPSGTVSWGLNGVPVSTAAGDQQSPTVVSDGAGGGIIAWNDNRGLIGYDIYAQSVTAAGATQWVYNGVAICVAVGSQNLPVAAPDGSGGAIVAWYDYRNPFSIDIYAQRVERFGQLGNPEPSIVNVKDYPNDQGGKVRIEWNASYLDANPYNSVGNYYVWRQAPPFAAEAALRTGQARLLAEGESPLDARHAVYRVTPSSAGAYYWEFVASQIAQGFPGYSYVTTTGSDSVGAGNPPTRFMIEAVANYYSVPTAYWNSAPDSGYSVDNLPPSAPAPFTGAYSAGATHLHWGNNSELDLAGYRLYRGSSSSFIPGAGNLISAQPDTGFADNGPAGNWYKLSAQDSHGNESLYAVLGPNGTLDAPGPGVVALAFSPPAPNPVRSEGAMFRIALPEAARVTLTLFDQQGRRVRELAGGTLPAGEHHARWDGRDQAGHAAPSGIYFARLEAMGRTLRVRFALVR